MHGYAQTHLQLYAQLRGAGWSDADLARAAAAWELAVPTFAGRFRGSGKPFLAHLVGTASILCAQRAEPSVVLAGLLHAVHQGRPGPTPAARDRVRRIVGVEAEELVARYAASPWSREWAGRAAREAARLDARDGAVVLMRLANELEEYLDDALLHVSSEKRDAVLAMAETAEALAAAVGRNHLARQLAEHAARARSAESPSGLVAPQGLSYTLPGMTLVHHAGWVVRQGLQAGWRRLRRPPGA